MLLTLFFPIKWWTTPKLIKRGATTPNLRLDSPGMMYDDLKVQMNTSKNVTK